ncbi:MAG: AAA family ATPase [Candidatus Acidiferrum sp.]|jgi:type II secretory pathway predicted ATPase ExeA
MYRKFFGLKDSPFNFSPDPRYLYLTKATEEARSSLMYGIQSRKGFLLLTGEVGTGKTTLLNYLLDWLRKWDVATSFVFNSQLQNVTQLFDFVMADLGIPCESCTKSQVLLKLNQWLLERYRAGKTTVLIVDEAQNLSDLLLEEIRLLTNLETSSEKLLQIILCGQPELEQKLMQPQLRQLRQRIVFRSRTVPLTHEETYGYIAERLRIAGGDGSPVFSPEAIDAIDRYAKGIPRVVNLLCEHALINSFAEGIKPIPANIVEDVAKEFQLDQVSAIGAWSDMNREPGDRIEGLLRDVLPMLRPADEPKPLITTLRERKP